MRIAIDCIPFLLRSAGVKTYLWNWFHSMRQQAGGDTLLAWPYLDPSGRYSHETSVTGKPQTLARLALLHAANSLSFPLLEWIGPRADVFHASHQLIHPPTTAKTTATLYDMTCWLVPETHSRANVRGAKLFADAVLKRAHGLIAISESTRRDAVRILGLDPARIEVIYPGVGEAYFDVPPPAVQAVAERYGLHRPYVLSVGTIEPRKNAGTLLDAWGALPASWRSEFDLVFAGPEGWGNPSTLARLRSGEAGVRYLGYVPEEDLPGLTAGAAVFVYISLYEGFGLPLGQAIAAGVPSITSNVSSLPEVAGEAALLVDPRSPAEVASALARLLSSASLRQRLAEEGRSRSRQFRWEYGARRSLEFFRSLS